MLTGLHFLWPEWRLVENIDNVNIQQIFQKLMTILPNNAIFDLSHVYPGPVSSHQSADITPLGRAGMKQKLSYDERTSNSCFGFTTCTQQNVIFGLVKHSLTGICHAVFAHIFWRSFNSKAEFFKATKVIARVLKLFWYPVFRTLSGQLNQSWFGYET